MLTPEQIADIARRVITAERMNFGKSSDSDGGRAQRNRDWARIAGIIYHGHPAYNPTPDPRWHIKDAGGGRPQSDDVLAFKDTRMIIDFIGGAGADGFTVRAGHWEGPIGPEQNIYAPPVPEGWSSIIPNPTPAPSEVWTTKHQAVWQRLANRSPLVVAQQLNHSFPGEVWGRKRAAEGRAISDNTVARKMPDGRLYGVKINPMIVVWGYLDAPQVLVEKGGDGAVNHLGDAPTHPVDPPPVDPPPVEPPPVDGGTFAQVLAALVDIAAKVDSIEAGLGGLSTAVNDQRQEVLDALNDPYDFSINLPSFMGGERTGQIKRGKAQE